MYGGTFRSYLSSGTRGQTKPTEELGIEYVNLGIHNKVPG